MPMPEALPGCRANSPATLTMLVGGTEGSKANGQIVRAIGLKDEHYYKRLAWIRTLAADCYYAPHNPRQLGLPDALNGPLSVIVLHGQSVPALANIAQSYRGELPGKLFVALLTKLEPKHQAPLLHSGFDYVFDVETNHNLVKASIEAGLRRTRQI